MNSKKIEAYKTKLSLTKRQRALLVGLLLGDGHLETQNNGSTYRLKVEHGLMQKAYLLFLHQEFKEWVLSSPKVKLRKGKPASYWFSTLSHEAFRFYAQQFYDKNGKKHIPKLIHKLLSPEALAIWFMDDGSRKSNKHTTYNIHTLGYTYDDLVRMQKAIERVFHFEVTLHKQKEKYWRMYIPNKSVQRFIEIVQPHIIPSMKYKLGNITPKE